MPVALKVWLEIAAGSPFGEAVGRRLDRVGRMTGRGESGVGASLAFSVWCESFRLAGGCDRC